jgi:xylulokinase
VGQDAVAVGIDLGTSGLKLAAVRADGSVVGRAARGYPTHRPTPDAAEQDPSDWLAALDLAAAELAVQVDPARWTAFALSAMLPTLVVLDDALVPVGPAITWEDGRAEAEASLLLAGHDSEALYRSTGQRMDGRYLLPMAARLAGSRVEFTQLVGAKDYLFHRLTGRLLTDPSTAAGYGNWLLAEAKWDATLPAGGRVPEVVPSTHAEPLLAERAQAWGCRPGIPVLVGAADSVLGSYGLGVHEPGPVAAVLGTSAVLIAEAATPEPDPGGLAIVTPTATGGFAREIDLLTLGSAIDWLGRLFGLDARRLLDLAGTATLPDAPLVLPFLAPGEQGVRWDPGLFGSVDGLSLRTGRAELALGLVAGLVQELAAGIALLSPQGGPVLAGGSVAGSAVFRQLLADASGREVHFDPECSDSSTVGAARFAAAHAFAMDAGVPASTVVTSPRADSDEVWRERAARHEAAVAARRDR